MKLKKMDKTPFRPKKSLGQNFLKDENIARKIVSAIALTPNDRVLEIGPGTGVLTKYLVEQAGAVTAVEIDNTLAPQLAERYAGRPNFELIHADVLKIPFAATLGNAAKWRVVANLPYHITSPVLFRLFENSRLFLDATLMVQKEVAQRIVAAPGSKTYGILSVFSQLYADVNILFIVSRNVFFPVPDVDSAVVHWKFKDGLPLTESEEPLFRSVVRGVFAQRRKMLRNSLKSIQDLNVAIEQLDFNLNQRPEQLSVHDFIMLIRHILSLRPAIQ
ncbi:MAG: 16S rRNA (adenine(1518)-N(6)/adenine(1519)-N(6))-dimethyltransferase RsmA [Candidatus Zhuqueibacterota bacterium]